MTCTLAVHHTGMCAALRHAMAQRQHLGTGSAASGARCPPRAAGGRERRRSSAPTARPGVLQGTSRDDCTPGGTWHYGGLAPGETRWLVPTPVTVYRHLAPCRHRLPGWAVELPLSPPVASSGAGHGVPSHCGASDAVPPAVLPRAARGGLLPAMPRSCW
jgi:hypothetical protein